MPLPSTANLREHKGQKMKRVRSQREVVGMYLRGYTAGRVPKGGDFTVRLSRVSARALDSDNLQTCLKAPRDAVTAFLGLNDDNDPRLRWLYAQTKDPKRRKRYTALRVEIAFAHLNCRECGHHLMPETNEEKP